MIDHLPCSGQSLLGFIRQVVISHQLQALIDELKEDEAMSGVPSRLLHLTDNLHAEEGCPFVTQKWGSTQDPSDDT